MRRRPKTTDVAAEHPEIVQRLQGYVKQMDADLGIVGKGPGVRAPGKVKDPKPLVRIEEPISAE